MHSMSTLYLSKAWRQGTFWERSHKLCRSSSFKSNGDHRHNRPNIFKDSRKGMPRTISWSTVSCSIFSRRLPVLNGFCSLWPTRDSATSSTCTWAKHGTAWQRGNGQCTLNHCDCMAAQIHPCDRHVTRLNNPNFPAFTCWVGCPSSTLSFSFSSNLWVTTSFGMSSLCSQHFWMPWPMAKPHQSRKTRPTFATCGLDAKHGDEETTATTSSWPTAHQSSVIGWIGSPALTGSSGKQRRHTSPKSREVTMQLMQSNTLRRTWNKTQTSQLLNSTRIQLGNLFTSVSLLSLRSLFFKPRTMRVGNFTSCLSSSAAASEIRKMHLSPPTKSSQKCRVATYGTCCISGTKYGPVRKDGNQVHWQKCGNQDSTQLLKLVKIYLFLPSGDSHSGSCCFRTKHWHEWCIWVTSCFFARVPSFGAHDEAMRQRWILAIRDDPCEHLEFQCEDAPIEWQVKGNGGSCDKNEKHQFHCQWMGEHVKWWWVLMLQFKKIEGKWDLLNYPFQIESIENSSFEYNLCREYHHLAPKKGSKLCAPNSEMSTAITVSAIPSHRSPLRPSCVWQNKATNWSEPSLSHPFDTVLRCCGAGCPVHSAKASATGTYSFVSRRKTWHPRHVLIDWRATNFSGTKVTDVGSFYDSWRKPGAPYPSPSLIFQVPFAPPVLPGAKQHECFHKLKHFHKAFLIFSPPEKMWTFALKVDLRWYLCGTNSLEVKTVSPFPLHHLCGRLCRLCLLALSTSNDLDFDIFHPKRCKSTNLSKIKEHQISNTRNDLRNIRKETCETCPTFDFDGPFAGLHVLLGEL